MRRSADHRFVQSLEPRRLMSSAATPFLGTPFTVGQVIEAENYDKGGEGVAYHVTTIVKPPGTPYRPGDAVAVQAGGSNGHDVGYTTVGEWLQYTISVTAKGAFSLEASVANAASGAKLHFVIDGASVGGSLSVPNTVGWQTYQTVTSSQFSLSAGTHTMRVYLDRAATNGAVGNLDWFKLVAQSTTVITQPTALGTLTWHTVAPIPQGITEGAGETVNGKLYVFSGFTDNNFYPSSRVYRYDPATNVWTRLHDMPVPVTHAGTCVDGNYIYIAGGYPPNAAHTYQLFGTTNVWRYDTVHDTWMAMPPLPAARGSGQLALAGGVLHYFGGDDTTRVADRHEHWALNLSNPSAGWTVAAPLPTARNRLGAVSLNGKIYAIGGGVGQDASEVTQSVVEVYDPATNSWSKVAPMPKGRTLIMAGCMVYNGYIIVAGGETSFNVPTNTVTAYNPATNTWTQLTPLPSPRSGGIGRVLGNMLIYTSGEIGFNTTTWIGTFG
jgi:N-acetylneuraminic acid mutarotase